MVTHITVHYSTVQYSAVQYLCVGPGVDGDGAGVGAARVLAQHHPGGAEEEQVV